MPLLGLGASGDKSPLIPLRSLGDPCRNGTNAVIVSYN